ncbi:OmpA family protein [Granulosicoccus sp.]|nr:OmpA family protein [Granulosicoccus sp.]
MSSNSLQLDLPPEDPPSITPWIVVIVAFATLLFLVSQLLTRIPASLQRQGSLIVSTAEQAAHYDNIAVTANGRELQLSGSINIDYTVQPLIDQLSRINGVQSVSQTLTIVDPAVQMQEAADQYIKALAGIDTSVVAFQPGSVSFTTDSDVALSQLLAVLKAYPDGIVRIEGHTDNTGPDTVNLRVSRDRAAAVASFLIARGVRADRLLVKGYGATQPIADNTTDAGRATNRRIEVSPVN